MSATQATVHTTLGPTPSQLVFGRDAILNTMSHADWALIKERKQKLIDKNNDKENKSCREHTYHIGDLVLMKNDSNTKYVKNPYAGPYEIVHVNDNGKLRTHKGATLDTVNIRNIHPYTPSE